MNKRIGQVDSAVVAWARVMRVYNSVSRLAAAQIARAGLSLPRFDVVAQLGSMGTCATQDALGKRLMVTKGNVSILIQKMVEDGLISRQENPFNRRCNRIHLTKKGEALRRKVLPQHEGWLTETFSILNRRERAELARLLGKVLSGLAASARKSPPVKSRVKRRTQS